MPSSTRERSTALGVVSGFALFVVLMLGLVGLSLAMGWVGQTGAQGSSRTIDLNAWLRLELIGGCLAGLWAGRVSRRRGSERSPLFLGVIVCGLGWLEGAEVLRYSMSSGASVSAWLAIGAPLLAGACIALGGWPELLRRRGAIAWRRVPRVQLRTLMPIGLTVIAIAIGVFAIPSLESEGDARVVSAALTFDFAVMIPALAYVLIIRARKLPWLTIVPIVIAGYALAAALIPNEHRFVLEGLRALLVPMELIVLVVLVVMARRALASTTGASADFPVRVRQAAHALTGARVPAGILSTELSILYYAFGGGSRLANHPRAFTVHREIGYARVLLGLLIVLAAETFVLHAIVSRASHGWAWALTGLSVYGAVWLIGDYRALAKRPMRIAGDALRLRVGLRWEADIPLERVRSAETIRAHEAKRGQGIANLAILGQANVALTLDEPVSIDGLYGIRRRSCTLLLRVDDGSDFCAALNCARAPDAPARRPGGEEARRSRGPS